MNIPNLKYHNGKKPLLIAGPCLVEDELITVTIARELKSLTDKYQIPFIFKASYRKANRTSNDAFEGIGDFEALNILYHIREDLQIPIMTDFHTPGEASMAADYVDILQIPAFLCRQTEMIKAAANTGKWINIKKGQFTSCKDMLLAADKAERAGNKNIMITERGTTFGYDDLVIDFRNIYNLTERSNYPIIMDVTHSLGNQCGDTVLIISIAKAARAIGAHGIFVETYPTPISALSDGQRMLPLEVMESLIQSII